MEPDMAADAGKETGPQQATLNVGITLREAREGLGLSVLDVAERIKFAPKQVEALEANDFAHLPEAPFLRGFVRSYARMLSLDEAPLIAALPGEPGKQAGAKAQAEDVVFPAVQSLSVNMMWLAGALGVALVLGLFVLLHNGQSDVKPTAVVEPVPLPALEPAVSAVMGASAVVVTEEQPNAAAASAVQAKTPEAVIAAEPVKVREAVKVAEPKKMPPNGQPAPEPQVAAGPAPAATAKPPVPLELLKRRPLHFVFGETAWAQVIDVNGVILLSRTNPAGSEQWVGGGRRAPYDVSIAHPNSVKLYYRGREIDLSAYPANAIAHLKVE